MSPLPLPPGISPSSPLGHLLTQVGELIEQHRFAEAIAPLTRAVALWPDNPNIQTELGRLYVELHRPSEALAPLERAISINPGFAPAHWQRGIALQQLGDFEGATRALECTVQIRPSLVDAHVRLALLYKDQKLRHKAVESYRRAAELTTDLAVKQFLEAQVLMIEGRESDAEHFLRSTLAHNPDFGDAHCALGQVLVRLGRFEEAAQHLEAHIARSPQAANSYYELVRSRKMTVKDADLLRRIDVMLEGETLDDVNRVVMLLARGKMLDDLGRFEDAMRTLDEAASLRSRIFSLKIEMFERQVDDVIARFNPRTLTTFVSANSDRTPVLILGLPRSGTTLVEQIISSHPEAVGAGELNFWKNQLHKAMLTGLTRDSIDSAATEYLENLRKEYGAGARITDKAPFNFLAIGLIHMAFPRAAIIHCHRHPVDNAISIHQTQFSKSSGIPTGGEDLVRYFRAYQRLMEHWHLVLPEGRLFNVSYERLVSSPNSEISKLIEHIGLPWNPVCLTPDANAKSVRTPSGWQVRQSINTGSVGRWRNYEAWLGPLATLLE